jgi:galactokinase
MDFGVLSGERGVGTLGGAQDQTAILCSARGQLEVFSWAPVTYERSVPWPASHVFVVGVSGVVASKSGAARDRYNRAARTAHRLVDAWNATGGAPVRTLRDAFLAAAGDAPLDEVPEALARAAAAAGDAEFTAAHLVGRLGQFYDETFVIVPQAAEALARGDLVTFGRLVDKSQAGAERALENQIAETVHLHRYARELGAAAASAFGAGFGGAVWAMVPAAEAERFIGRWRERYLRAHPNAAHRAQFFTTVPSPPAFELLDSSLV